MSNEDAEEYVEKLKDLETAELATLEANKEEYESEMAELKTKLYAKFGKSINLEAKEE